MIKDSIHFILFTSSFNFVTKINKTVITHSV